MPTGTPHLLPRRRFIDDMPDKGLFAGIAAVGFASIISLKVEQFSPESVAAFAVALMLVYGYIAYRIPLVRLRLDRLGDNFYYLGFIYTLASLSAALIELRITGITTNAILGAFGIALVTTIFGIAGRVIFVQMRSEIDDVEEIIRRDILEASTQLRGQLSAALNDLDTFCTGVQQATKECLENTTDHAKAHLEKISSVAQQAADRINEAFVARQDHAQKQLDLISKTSTAVEQLIQKVERSDTVVAKAHLDQISAVAQAAASRINDAFAARQSQLGKEAELVGNLSGTVERLVHRLESFDVAKTHIDQISVLAKQAATKIEAAFADRTKTAENLLDLSARAAAAVERLMRRVESSDLPTEKLEAQLRGFAVQLNDLVVRLGKTVDAVTSDHEDRIKRPWSIFSKR
jgi:hypothetical protein